MEKYMKTAEEIKMLFAFELQELLNKYSADMDINQPSDQWGTIVVTIPAVYDQQGELIREFIRMDFGNQIWAKPDLL